MAPTVLFLLYAAALGLIVGSYLNVLIHRLPRGQSTVLPRSRCPRCGRAVQARDNIPVLSYLLLRGKCRHCATPISIRYPLVEATTGALFVAAAIQFGPSLDALGAAILIAFLLALGLIDLEHFLLPDKLTLPGTAVGLALSPWLSWTNLPSSLVGALGGAGLLLAIWGAWYVVRREEGMGLGDVKLVALLGAFLGWSGGLVAFFFGTFLGAAAAVYILLSGQGEMKSKLPYGTFLCLGGLIALFAGPAVIRYYMGFF